MRSNAELSQQWDKTSEQHQCWVRPLDKIVVEGLYYCCPNWLMEEASTPQPMAAMCNRWPRRPIMFLYKSMRSDLPSFLSLLDSMPGIAQTVQTDCWSDRASSWAWQDNAWVLGMLFTGLQLRNSYLMLLEGLEYHGSALHLSASVILMPVTKVDGYVRRTKSDRHS